MRRLRALATTRTARVLWVPLGARYSIQEGEELEEEVDVKYKNTNVHVLKYVRAGTIGCEVEVAYVGLGTR